MTGIIDEGVRSLALADLAPSLPESLVAAALHSAFAIGDEGARSHALAAMAPRLPEPERTAALTQAIDAARAIDDEGARSLALAEIAPHLTESLVTTALDAARTIGDERYRSHALAALAPRLPEAERSTALAQALDDAHAIGDEWDRSEALAALAPRLPEPERTAALTQAIDAARAIGNEGDRSLALVVLAPHLPERLLDEALDAARGIRYEGHRSRALAALLASRLPEAPMDNVPGGATDNDTDEPWFVAERSEALAGVLLTTREDVHVRKEREFGGGVKFLVEIDRGDAWPVQRFVVKVRGVLSSDQDDWESKIQPLFCEPHDRDAMPICVFVVDVRATRAFYAWRAEPRIESRGPTLRFHDYEPGGFRPLDPVGVGDLVEQVKAWSRVLPGRPLPA